MNEVQKRRIKTVLKYTWPFYIVTALLIGFLMSFIFGITHRLPAYKTMTLFVSGVANNADQLREDTLEKFKDKELKSFSCYYADPSVNEQNYYTKLSVVGYHSADVLVIPSSVLEIINAAAFAIEIDDELYNSYYQGFSKYILNDKAYGIEIDPEKVKPYFYLPNETCYMFLNATSQNIGQYSTEAVKEHDNALRVVQDWGK